MFLNMVVYDPAVAPADERIADAAAVARQMCRGVPLTYGHAGNRIRDVCQAVADNGLTLSAANVSSELGTWRIGQVFDAFVDGRGRIHATARLHDAVCERLRADGLGVSLSHFISGSDERPVELALTRDPVRPGCRVTGSQPHQTYRTSVMADTTATETTTTNKRPAESDAPPAKRQRTNDGRFVAVETDNNAAAAADELQNAPEAVREALAVVLARHKAQTDAKQREAEAKLAALTEELNKRKQNDEVLDHMRESQAADTAAWLERNGGLSKEQVEAMMPLLKENAFNALGEGLRVCSHGGRRSGFSARSFTSAPAPQEQQQQEQQGQTIENPTIRDLLNTMLFE